jgi:Holliday junction DNA helicase RuvA
MLAYISGRVVYTTSGEIIIKTPSGLGYLVFVNFNKKYMVNENIDLFLYQAIREDASILFGFETAEDRIWLEKLLKVSGVGPKMAAMIIHSLGWSSLAECIRFADSDKLSMVKGLGSKTAKKIILEIQGSSLQDLERFGTNLGSQYSIDFSDTLIGLGYKRGEIVGAIAELKKLGNWDETSLVNTVKKALELLRKK